LGSWSTPRRTGPEVTWTRTTGYDRISVGWPSSSPSSGVNLATRAMWSLGFPRGRAVPHRV